MSLPHFRLPVSSLRTALAATMLLSVVAQGIVVPTSHASLHRAVHTLNADAETLRLAHEAGFDTVVQLFSWRQIEPNEGEYHWQYPDEVVQARHTTG